MTLSFDPASLPLAPGHFIAGQLVAGEGVIDLFAPSDRRRLTAIPQADAETVDRAVWSAQVALKTSGWGLPQPRDRVRALHAWADLIEAEAGTLARLEAICASRPVAQATMGDVVISAEQIRFFAEFADKEGGSLVPTSAGQLGLIAAEPYGVVGAITPWNFPVSMAAWKLAPALAAGNAVVL